MTAAGPTGAGEAWRITGRWSDARPGVELSLAIPARLGAPGVWRAVGSWERERWRVAEPSATGRDAGLLEGTRRTASLAMESWATGWLRWRARAGLERWRVAAGGSERNDALVALGGELEARPVGDRLSARLELDGWRNLGEVPAVGRSAVDVRWRSATEPRGSVLSARLGAAVVSSGAPRFLWPGAGSGRARPALLRAHPLLHAGAISGPAFGRRLVHGGTELVRWLGGPLGGSGLPLGLGVAAFLDVADAGGSNRDSPFLMDAGLGGRAGLGALGRLRLDLARGLVDGETAVSLGWEAAWPGR